MTLEKRVLNKIWELMNDDKMSCQAQCSLIRHVMLNYKKEIGELK